jgi:hypothetical protein
MVSKNALLPRQAKNGDRAFTQSLLLEINVDGTEGMMVELLA